MRTPFFGPAYVARSSNIADNRLVNLYPEIVESKQGKEVGAFYTTPGLELVANAGAGPLRQMFTAERLYGVSGNRFFSMDAATMSPIGLGAALPAGPGAYSWTKGSSTLAPIALPFTPATADDTVWIVNNGPQIGIFIGIAAAQQDGFVLINEPGTYHIWQSNLLDLTFDALSFGSASADADDVRALAQIHREIFVFKRFDTEVWINVGSPGFAFQRLDGVYLELGIMAPSSLTTVGENLCLLAQNDQGQGIVVLLAGYQPHRISTHAIESEIASYPDAGADCVAYSYEQEGHVFYVMNFTAGDATWVYDVTASGSAGVPMWHQRDVIDANGRSHRHWGANRALFNGLNLVGDYRNGNIYQFRIDAADDNTEARRWLRSWRASPQPLDQPATFSSLRIDMQTGIAVLPDVTPYCSLRWSDDGGHRWSNPKVTSAGALGETAARVKFRRLGSTRRNSGLDRIFEVSSGDALPACLIGAVLE